MAKRKRKNRAPDQGRVGAGRPPESSKELPEQEGLVAFYRDKKDAILKVGFVAGAAVAFAAVGYYNGEKREETQNQQESSVSGHRSQDLGREKALDVQKFDPRVYQPPKEGRIWKQSEVLDPNRQTVIYVRDVHGRPDYPPSWPIQREIFAVIEDAIDKYGQVPIVLEEWVDFGKGDDYNFKQHVYGNSLEDLAGQTDFEKRRSMAMSLLSNGSHPAPRLLPVVYTDAVVPVASHNKQQEIRSLAITSRFYSLGDSLERNVSCRDLGVKADIGIRDAVQNPEQSKAARTCYCSFDGLFESAAADFRQDRSFEAPKEEVRRAVAHNNPFVFLITGTAHTDETLRQLEGKDVNYIVITLRSVKEGGIDTTTVLPPRKGVAPLCKEWSQMNQVEMQMAIQDLREKFTRYAEKVVRETERDMLK